MLTINPGSLFLTRDYNEIHNTLSEVTDSVKWSVDAAKYLCDIDPNEFGFIVASLIDRDDARFYCVITQEAVGWICDIEDSIEIIK